MNCTTNLRDGAQWNVANKNRTPGNITLGQISGSQSFLALTALANECPHLHGYYELLGHHLKIIPFSVNSSGNLLPHTYPNYIFLIYILRPQYMVLSGHSLFPLKLLTLLIVTKEHIWFLKIHNFVLLEKAFTKTYMYLMGPRWPV